MRYFAIIDTARTDLDVRDVALMIDRAPGFHLDSTVYTNLADLTADVAGEPYAAAKARGGDVIAENHGRTVES